MEPNTIFANRYKLENRIGLGGFSEVWKATDQMADDSAIAIKIYAPERGMDEQGLKQFRREYAVVLNLNHSNLLTARYFDIWEGRPYLVMPLIDGGSLYDKLEREGTFNEKQAADLIHQVADGLQHLHSHEILHQDIKPDNILIGKGDTYLLMDFGISTRMRSTLRKQTGMAKAMTVAYAPPERFAAKPMQVPAGDVFSLGVLVYEMITGDVPWMGNGGVSLQTGAAVPELPETFSKGFRDLVTAMMAVKPEDRPTTGDLVEKASHFLRYGNWPVSGESSGKNAPDSARSSRSRETQIIDTSGIGGAEGTSTGSGADEQFRGQHAADSQSHVHVPPSAGAARTTKPLSAEAAEAALGGSSESSSPDSSSSSGQSQAKQTQIGKTPDAPPVDHKTSASEEPTGPRPTKKSGGSGKWIVAAIVLIVLLAGGYFGYSQFSQTTAEREARIITLLEQAASNVEAGDLDAALLSYQSVLDRDRNNETALTEISNVRQQIRERDAEIEADRTRQLEQTDAELAAIRAREAQLAQELADRIEQDRIRNEATAAQRTITGTVVDSRSGTTLTGASVTVRGTNTGALTNPQGGFTITAPNQNATLVFTATGYARQEIALNGRTSLRVELVPDRPAVIEPSLTASPISGTISLAAGFTPDPWERNVSIQNNTVDLDVIGYFGYVTQAPTLSINYTSGTFPLYIGATSAATDLVILVRTPNGQWLYNDDFIGTDPQVGLPNPQSGLYKVWVGTYSSTTASATLYITELDDDDSSSISTLGSGSGPDHTRPPQYGSVNLRAGFTPDPHTQSILAGGSINLENFGYWGYVATIPDYVVNFTAGSGSLPLIIKVGDAEGDTVILIYTPDGRWEYNDDFEGLNAGVRFDNPRSGAYKIWVGSYGSDFVQSTLHITEMN